MIDAVFGLEAPAADTAYGRTNRKGVDLGDISRFFTGDLYLDQTFGKQHLGPVAHTRIAALQLNISLEALQSLAGCDCLLESHPRVFDSFFDLCLYQHLRRKLN